ncbi:diaminopropionate ammonia-lyase [Mycolicibacterium obuense]|uniref:Diaminopropionate ammonia-lyase n=1 Tax=Mycolicibacterium obuense TaxID=1807 RepID=A0A4R5XAY4_9MYCO|nr:diaminopropionate ammonia-lyase [Mycolicibacterium obuense]TDL10500.1 diaminopropionate ammonia-lyase [Mycolicibacterium obuense]
MTDVEIYLNPAAKPLVPTAGFAAESRVPQDTHRTLPGYRPTAVHSCPGLADRLGVRAVLVKDESERLGLPSFKILGASWAALTTVQAAWGANTNGPLSVESVRSSIGSTDGRGLVAATDGNHGRGVARVAAMLGLDSTILVPAGTAQARIDAIASEGASVDVVDGTYDDAIAASARLADNDHLVVSDTSWEGYSAAPRAVVEGYSTLFYEIDDVIDAHGLPRPDVVALQAGVGAFAASGLRHYRDGRPNPPRTVVVEPASANCLMASARAGGLTLVPGPHPSSMAGLNCGMPSELVWPVLAAGTDVFVGIADSYAEDAMRALADEGIVAGESGAAGLGGLLALAERGTPEERAHAGLHPDACVLLVNTEGATDPANYERVVGRPATDVATALEPH